MAPESLPDRTYSDGTGITNGSRDIQCDVAVVGYGPVGQTMSALLKLGGLSVVAVEKHTNRYHLSRAGHFDGEIMRIWQRLGVAKELELLAQVVTQMSLVTGDLEVLLNRKIDRPSSGWREGYLCPSTQIEDVVSARAEQLGVSVLMGTTCTGLEERDGSVLLTVRPSQDTTAAATTTTITAKYVIGTDGANSFIREAMGSKRHELGFEPTDNLIIDFEHFHPDRDIPELQGVYQIFDPKRPQHAGRWGGSSFSRFEYMRMPPESLEELQSEENCWKLLSRWGLGPEDGVMKRRAIHRFEASLTDKWRAGRAFLAGDSAHTMPPHLGQGMCSGLRDAFNLAWKLVAVVAGQADESLLDGYQSEREPHVLKYIHMSIRMGRLALITDEEEAKKRNDVIRSGKAPPPPPPPRIESGLVAGPGQMNPSSCDLVGRPSIQGRVARKGSVGLLDDFLAPGWKLISRHAVDQSGFTERQKELVATLSLQFAHVSRGAQPNSASFKDLDGDYDDWYMGHGLRAFLQRPDNYLFGVAKTMQDVPGLLDELGTCLTKHGYRGLGY